MYEALAEDAGERRGPGSSANHIHFSARATQYRRHMTRVRDRQCARLRVELEGGAGYEAIARHSPNDPPIQLFEEPARPVRAACELFQPRQDAGQKCRAFAAATACVTDHDRKVFGVTLLEHWRKSPPIRPLAKRDSADS